MNTLLEIADYTSTKRTLTSSPTRFHIAMNVRNLNASIVFLSRLFGCDPVKRRADYAKFELDDPPLVLSLEPSTSPAGGSLNHLGFRVADSAALVEVQRRLEMHGIVTQREEGVECCYARQSKFWLHDPDGNLWEVYTLDEDIEHRGLPPQLGTPDAAKAELLASAPRGPAAALWSHRLGQPLPARLFVNDETVDEALLQGTFNVHTTPTQRTALLAEIFRALKPGGKLRLHMLTGDRPVPPETKLQLPGPAAMVQTVPVTADVVAELAAAGFTDLVYEKFHGAPCFRVGEVEMRETLLALKKPTF